MFIRLLFLLGLLAASVGIPYMTSNSSDLWKQIKSRFPTFESNSSPGEMVDAGAGGASWASPGRPGAGHLMRATGDFQQHKLTYDMAEVFRMDVTPTWIYRRWERKSTQLAELDLHGIRVPLVTGKSVDDLAGSLTYYFNREGKVQRISFYGRTGDPRRLITLMASKYGLRNQQPKVSGEQVYQVKWNGRAQSELRIRPAAVMWASVPHASYEVQLELERPGSSRYLKQAAIFAPMNAGSLTPRQ